VDDLKKTSKRFKIRKALSHSNLVSSSFPKSPPSLRAVISLLHPKKEVSHEFTVFHSFVTFP
jgi:hypothetical protein